MSIIFIIYVVLALAVLFWASHVPHTPTSLDPEPASVWDFPPWYMLIMMLIIIGILVYKATQ